MGVFQQKSQTQTVFSEAIWLTVTKLDLRVACDEGLQIILHTVALTEGQGHSDLEEGPK